MMSNFMPAYAGNKEYDYEIDAYTGRILSKDTDIEYVAPKAVTKKQQGKTDRTCKRICKRKFCKSRYVCRYCRT